MLKNNYLKLALTAVLLVQSTACTFKNMKTKDGKELVNEFDLSEIVKNSKLKDSDKANSILDEVDLLMSANGFVHADILVDVALGLDSENFKAKLYKRIFAITGHAEGFVERTKGIWENDEKSKHSFDEKLKRLEAINPVLARYLVRKNQSSIKDEKDLQKHMDSIASSIDSLRNFLKENKENIITIKYIKDFEVDAYGEGCTSDYLDEKYRIYCQTTAPRISEVQVNAADIEGLQQTVAGLQILSVFTNSYDLTGLIKTLESKDTLPENNQALAYEIKNRLSLNNDFGTIRDRNAFKVLNDLGADVIASVNAAMKIQNELCKYGRPGQNSMELRKNRPGYLFNEGFCVKDKDDDKTQKLLKNLAIALAGQSVIIDLGHETIVEDYNGYKYAYKTDKVVETTINAQAFIQSPMTDLKTSLDLEFNQCGEAVVVADKSLGGLLVKKDANKILKKLSTCE